jgi:hypothetical protein
MSGHQSKAVGVCSRCVPTFKLFQNCWWPCGIEVVLGLIYPGLRTGIHGYRWSKVIASLKIARQQGSFDSARASAALQYLATALDLQTIKGV